MIILKKWKWKYQYVLLRLVDGLVKYKSKERKRKSFVDIVNQLAVSLKKGKEFLCAWVCACVVFSFFFFGFHSYWFVNYLISLVFVRYRELSPDGV